MAKKEFLFKGKSVDELKALSMTELSELFTSGKRRSIKRGFNDNEKKLIEKIRAKDNVKTHIRNMIVFPEFVGKTIQIHSGKDFIPVNIVPEMIGMYFGALVSTRKIHKFGGGGVKTKKK